MRALWFASESRFATLAYGVLLATGFHLFVHARIAMLDIFYPGFLALAAWQFAAAIRQPEQGRSAGADRRGAGVGDGREMNALVVAMLPGLTFLVARASGRRRLLMSRRGARSRHHAARGDAVARRGATGGHAATYLPGFLFRLHPITEGLVFHHQFMLLQQEQVLKPHPYQSTLGNGCSMRARSGISTSP